MKSKFLRKLKDMLPVLRRFSGRHNTLIPVGRHVTRIWGVFNDFLNNVWFGFTVVYGCFYCIVNAHYKGYPF